MVRIQRFLTFLLGSTFIGIAIGIVIKHYYLGLVCLFFGAIAFYYAFRINEAKEDILELFQAIVDEKKADEIKAERKLYSYLAFNAKLRNEICLEEFKSILLERYADFNNLQSTVGMTIRYWLSNKDSCNEEVCVKGYGSNIPCDRIYIRIMNKKVYVRKDTRYPTVL